jgi:allene oxide cyclase
MALVAVLLASLSLLRLRGNVFAQANGPKTIHVVEHAVSDTVGDTLPAGDSVGDTLGFHNPVFDASNTHQVGTDNGACLRTVVTGKTEWECFWTTTLAAGRLPSKVHSSTTAQTRPWRSLEEPAPIPARGERCCSMRGGAPVGSEFDFIFTLTLAK